MLQNQLTYLIVPTNISLKAKIEGKHIHIYDHIVIMTAQIYNQLD